MNINKISMRSGKYYRLYVDDTPVEWAKALFDDMDVSSWEELDSMGYSGVFEIECFFDGNIISEVNLVYYLDEYDVIKELDDNENICNQVFTYLKENGNSVPDNEELMLGDEEWLEKAYPNN